MVIMVHFTENKIIQYIYVSMFFIYLFDINNINRVPKLKKNIFV